MGAAVFPDPNAIDSCAPGVQVFPPTLGDAPAGTPGPADTALLETLGHIGANGGTPTAATLAAQFFMDWTFARVKWFTNYSSSGSVSTAPVNLFGWTIDTPEEKYLFVLALVVVLALGAKNLVRGHIGRAWMAIRDMDVAVEGVLGLRLIGAGQRRAVEVLVVEHENRFFGRNATAETAG